MRPLPTRVEGSWNAWHRRARARARSRLPPRLPPRPLPRPTGAHNRLDSQLVTTETAWPLAKGGLTDQE